MLGERPPNNSCGIELENEYEVLSESIKTTTDFRDFKKLKPKAEAALQNSLNNLPAPTKAPSNPFSRNAYQKVTALIPKIGIPATGSNLSLTSIKLMFVPH